MRRQSSLAARARYVDILFGGGLVTAAKHSCGCSGGLAVELDGVCCGHGLEFGGRSVLELLPEPDGCECVGGDCVACVGGDRLLALDDDICCCAVAYCWR